MMEPDKNAAASAPAPACCSAPPIAARTRRILLVGGYVAARLDGLTDADMDALEAVMELPDADLADWLTGRLPIPPEADSPMLRAMKDAAGQ